MYKIKKIYIKMKKINTYSTPHDTSSTYPHPTKKLTSIRVKPTRSVESHQISPSSQQKTININTMAKQSSDGRRPLLIYKDAVDDTANMIATAEKNNDFSDIAKILINDENLLEAFQEIHSSSSRSKFKKDRNRIKSKLKKYDDAIDSVEEHLKKLDIETTQSFSSEDEIMQLKEKYFELELAKYEASKKMRLAESFRNYLTKMQY